MNKLVPLAFFGGSIFAIFVFSILNTPTFVTMAGLSFLNGPIVSILLIVLFIFGLLLAIPRRITSAEAIIRQIGKGEVTSEELQNVITNGMSKVDALLEASEKIVDPAVSFKIEKIARVADRIFEGFIDDPSDIRRSRNFLDIYLSKSVEIVSAFQQLEGKDGISEEAYSNIKELLDTIELTFEKQYEKNLENDILDLDVQMSVLNKKMNLSKV